MKISASKIIPDGEILLRYCNPIAFPDGQREIPTSIFNDPSLSCDWKKYRDNPKTSYHIKEGKSRVIFIEVCDEIRNPRNPKRTGEIVPAWHQNIYHDPITHVDDPHHGANEAHSLIEGKKKIAVKEALVNKSFYIDF